jgi:hypothetical protein
MTAVPDMPDGNWVVDRDDTVAVLRYDSGRRRTMGIDGAAQIAGLIAERAGRAEPPVLVLVVDVLHADDGHWYPGTVTRVTVVGAGGGDGDAVHDNTSLADVAVWRRALTAVEVARVGAVPLCVAARTGLVLQRTVRCTAPMWE